MIQYPISNQQGLVDSVNYLLSGPSGTGQLFKGTNTDVVEALPGYSIQQDSGEIVYNLPIVTAYAQSYLTGISEYVAVPGIQDRVALTASLSMDWDYTAYEPSQLEVTVSLNRYFATSSFTQSYNTNLLFFDKTCASKSFVYNLDTNKDGIDSVTVSGTRPTITLPTGGSLYPAVDTTLVNLNADSPGAGLAANLNIQLSYGAASAYDLLTNTAITVAAAGTGWSAGETITIAGNTFVGGATPANDMTVTVATVGAGSTTVSNQDIIFPTIYDQPTQPGLYRYMLEVSWQTSMGTVDIDNVQLGSRSISTQLIKT